MAASNGSQGPSLADELREHPYRFDFFQVVRLIEALARETESPSAPVGQDYPAPRECIRFRAEPSLTFAAASVCDVEWDKTTEQPEASLSFIGLTGANGVLPYHYTSLVIERSHARHNDIGMRAFFDLFNHRTASLFYRAWEKYRFHRDYERRVQSGRTTDDLFTYCLYALTGLAPTALRNRLQINDEATLFFGGHFANATRSAVGLESVLSDYFGVPVAVQQFCGQWLYLSPDNQSSFPSPTHPLGRNLQLGHDVLVGDRVWDVESKFRIRLGPVDYPTFESFMPNGRQLRSLTEMCRLYVGPQFDFDVQIILKKEDVPACQLNGAGASPPRLGWNTWACWDPFEEDNEDSVFCFREI